MLDFMDYIQHAFSDAISWNSDNTYSALTQTAECKSRTMDMPYFEAYVDELSSST